MTKELKMGIYRHYKGNLYQVLGLAHDADQEGRICVVYIGLELDGAHLGPRIAVRTLETFTEFVDAPTARFYTLADGSEREGYPNRFTYLGLYLTGEMLNAL
jgi:hypothetical protein